MKSVTSLLLFFSFAVSAHAQHHSFQVDVNKSEVAIRLNTTHEVVNGIFHVQSGIVDFDQSSHSMSGSIVVSTGSGKTGSTSRDKRMHKDILMSEQFPVVSFLPKSYRGSISDSADSVIYVEGDFTLLGKPHDITLPMQIHVDGSTANAKCQFVVPYVQWGVKNPSFLFWKADNDVTVTLSLSGTLSK